MGSFHSHSGEFCAHGTGELEDTVIAAKNFGYSIFGLSEHMPRYDLRDMYPDEAHLSLQDLSTQFQNYLVKANALREKNQDETFEILVGLETEWISDEYETFVESLRPKVDYVVGSIHHTYGIPIDYSFELYQLAEQTAYSRFKMSCATESLFCAYFDEQYEMMTKLKPEIIGHFDLVRLYRNDFPLTQSGDVWKRVERNVKFGISIGALFEINTRGWKKGTTGAYPCPDIIRLVLTNGGKLTLSDDSHGPKDVGMHYAKARDYLTENGIDTLFYLSCRTGSLQVRSINDVLRHSFWNKII